MTKRRSKKRTLTASIISLILCVSMLLGTTMAWFTDTVSNTGNRIVTGELGVQLLKYDGTDYADISDGQGDIFATQGEEGERLNGILWEPGKTEVVLLKVANTGNLALNYNIILDVTNETNAALEKVLSYAVIPNVAGKKVEESNVSVYSDLNIASWQDIEVMNGIDIGVVPAGSTKAAPNGALLAGESDYFALAVHMDEDAGNIYQNQSIVIDVKVDAKQMPYEYDSFSNKYDENAEYPQDGIVLHVSTDGDDSNSGTQKDPFATIAKANEVISSMEREGESVYVLIHGGTYMLTESVEFDSKSGGTEKNKVIYMAAGDGDVVFSGYQQIPTTSLSSIVGSSVENLIPVDARSFVKKVNLGTYGLDSKDLSLVEGKSRDKEIKDLLEYYTLLLNGKEQDLAQWPNYGETVTLGLSDVVDPGANVRGGEGAILKYTYSNIDNWTQESLNQAVVRGYLSASYREEWNQIKNVDTENQTVTLKYHSDFTVQPGRNWRIVNMLEELDVPGEYCIDYRNDELALYYYPPYELNDMDSLELSVIKDVELFFKDTQYIVFDGIEFTGFRNTDATRGLVTLQNANNIEIRNCTFSHNDGFGNIVITGKNNIVEACGFYNCGAIGVVLNGNGDGLETLEKENNVIINNHFYNSGYGNSTYHAGAVSDSYYSEGTVGNVIKNNLIHHIYGTRSIIFNGAEYDISYNEVSNGLRTVSDYGLIYTGYLPYVLGTTINYNYLHDFGSYRDNSDTTYGIYLDDWASGQTANNNIVIANSENATGIISIGAYNTIQNNIVANATNGIRQADRERTTTFIDDIANISDALKSKYPFMLTLPEKANEMNGIFPVVGNVISNNIAYNAAHNFADRALTLSTIENNLRVNTTDNIFVNPAQHDWRITSEYAEDNNLSQDIMTEDNFQMDEIGIQKDVWNIQNPLDSFKQVYPKNGAVDVEYDNIVLNWEKALFADEYKYVVATDPEFTNVVASGVSVFEHVDIGGLAGETTYYWKVTAVNTTKQLGAEWASEGEAFSFTTKMEEVVQVDKTKLNEAIAEATTLFATVKDGEENKVGDYKAGTEVKLAAILKEANETAENQKATQDEIDAEVVKLRCAIDGIDAYKYNGYINLDTSTADKWVSLNANTTFTANEGVITVTGKKNVAYKDNYNLVTFDVKSPLVGSKYLGITFRVMDATTSADDCYDGVSYLLWITPDGIDLQKNPSESAYGLSLTSTNKVTGKNNEWQNFQIATISLEGGGVRIIVKVDGEEAFDFVDNGGQISEDNAILSPIYGTGTIAFQSNTQKIEIRAAETIPTEIY